MIDIERAIEVLERVKIGLFNEKIDGEPIRPYLDTAISALEKQMPKKPLEQKYVNYEIKNEIIGQCPTCKLRWDVTYWEDYCGNCGQKLDWSWSVEE